MIKKPILTFPFPISAEKSKKQGFPGKIFTPTKAQQIDRNERKITELDRVLTNQSASLQKEAGNIIPEMILVLETADVKDFKMPVAIFIGDKEIRIHPNEKWQNLADNPDLKNIRINDLEFYIASSLEK